MKKMPLRYNISEWSQLVDCMSNFSNLLHLKVKKIVHDRRLNGTVIEVYHDDFGPLFCYLVDGQGPLIASNDPLIYEMSTKDILRELERFGFFITFDRRRNLPQDQIMYLETVNRLGFDKIRVLDVYQSRSDGVVVATPHVIAFNIEPNPGWLDNSYSASLSEYTNAITQGTAINLSSMSEAKRFQWDWLDYVASIEDIIAENKKQR